MLRVASRQAKEESIDLLRRVVHALIAPYTITAQREAIFSHLEWMKRQSAPMDIDCELRTLEEGTTQLVLKYKFVSPSQH